MYYYAVKGAPPAPIVAVWTATELEALLAEGYVRYYFPSAEEAEARRREEFEAWMAAPLTSLPTPRLDAARAEIARDRAMRAEWEEK